MTTINDQRRQPPLPRGYVFLATVSPGTSPSEVASVSTSYGTLCSLCRHRRKYPTKKKTGIWAELERHLTEFITCQRHIGVLHTKEQVRVHNNIVISPQAYGFLGFLCTASERLIFISLFGVLRFSGYQPPNQGNRKLGHTLTPSHLLIATGSGVEIWIAFSGEAGTVAI